MTCPECGNSEIRISQRAHWGDIFQRVRGRQAFRCRKCRRRFFAPLSPQSGLDQGFQSKHSTRPKKLFSTRRKKNLVRALAVLSIFAMAFVIFLLFLRYLTTERAPDPDSGDSYSALVLPMRLV
jgi:preprotein translocase subunit SecG